MAIADIRTDYRKASLSEHDVAANPITQFSKWFEEALHAEIPEINAMGLSTVTAEGHPASRIVLLKEIDAHGFVWFTNYESRKGHELAQHPYASLLFHWIELERQVRIEGRVEKTSAEESDSYFAIRPLGSRIGAIASHQSQPVADRQILEKQFTQVQEQVGEHPVRPAHWGGYRLIPNHMEFWQGRPSRLHDRIAYTLDGNGQWQRQRLQP